MNDEEYMEIAYQEALKALEYDDVPIGCIIVKDDEIIVFDIIHGLRILSFPFCSPRRRNVRP